MCLCHSRKRKELTSSPLRLHWRDLDLGETCICYLPEIEGDTGREPDFIIATCLRCEASRTGPGCPWAFTGHQWV